MNGRILPIVFLFIILSLFAKAQSGYDGYLEGQIAVTTNGKAAFINIGGASIKCKLKKFNVSIMMGPSIKFEKEKTVVTTIPVLGVGPQFYFLKNKRFIVSIPSYYISTKKIWTTSIGVGYLLTKQMN
jgi:hypothetical protein